MNTFLFYNYSSQFYLHDSKGPLAVMTVPVHGTCLHPCEQSRASGTVPITHDLPPSLGKKDDDEIKKIPSSRLLPTMPNVKTSAKTKNDSPPQTCDMVE